MSWKVRDNACAQRTFCFSVFKEFPKLCIEVSGFPRPQSCV